MPRCAVIAHIFYEDLGRELLDRLAAVEVEFDILVTGRFDDAMRRSIIATGRRVEFVPSQASGFDVAPFLDALGVAADHGYDLFCKVHTKRGDFVFGQRWREACLDAVIGSTPQVERIIAAFEKNRSLAIAGPADLYLSVEANMLGNRENLEAFTARCFPGGLLPNDWGFFAGTIFWGRTDAFVPFLELRKGKAFPAGLGKADGHPEHALERLFGLAGWPETGRVGLISGSTEGSIETSDRPPPDGTIHNALARLGRPKVGGNPTRADADLIAQANPLLHYLRFGRHGDVDPNGLFNNRWYLAANPHLDPQVTPLADFVARTGVTPAPSPLFDVASYASAHPWLARLGINPLTDFLEGQRSQSILADYPGASEPGSDGGARAFTVAIKVAARRDSETVWGDTAFAEGLAGALEGLGHRPEIHFREEWYGADAFDAVIVLRGPGRYAPQPGSLNILWNISHPDQVTLAEMELYDWVFVAGEGHARLLSTVLKTPVSVLQQATDTKRFFPGRHIRPKGVLFVGNSRGEDRKVVRWAVEEGLHPEIIGSGWSDFAPSELVSGTRIDNRLLRERYAQSRAILNDHWPAMRAFGFVSNRLLDVLASGGVPVSDGFPAVRRLLGEAVVTVDGRAAMRGAVARAGRRTAAARRSVAKDVMARHSFEQRSSEIRTVIRTLRVGRKLRPPKAPRLGGAAVRVIVPGRDAAWGHQTFARLVLPMTQDASANIDIGFHTADQLGDLSSARLLVLSSEAIDDPATRAILISPRPEGTRTIIDCARLAEPSSAGEKAAREQLLDILAGADEIWAPDANTARVLMARGMPTRQIPNSIDQRVWRDFHARLSFAEARQTLRVLIACDGRDPWVKEFLAASEPALHGRLQYLVVGPGVNALLPTGRRRAWIRTIDPPPARRNYLRHVEWLRSQAQFHIGISSGLAEADRLFLEYAALGAVPLIASEQGVDAAVRDDCLALVGDGTVSDALSAVAQIVRDPMPFQALAAAARDHVWRARDAADASEAINGALKEIGGL